MDIRTLLLCLSFINLLMCLYAYIIKKSQPNFSGINFWIVSNAWISTGYLFMACRNELPACLGIITAQLLFVSAGFIRILGLNRFFRRKNTPASLIFISLILLVYISIITYFTYGVDSILIRTLVIGLTLSAISIYSAIIILKNKTAHGQYAFYLIASLFFLFSAIFIARLLAWTLFPEARGLFNSNFINDLQFTTSMMIDISWTTLFFVIHNQRVNSQLKESKALLDALFRTNPIPTGILDFETFSYVRINDCMFDKLGYSIADIKGRRPSEIGIIDKATASLIRETLVKERHIHNFKTCITARSGKTLHIIFYADLVEQQQKKYVYATFIDITEQIVYEEKLNKAKDAAEIANRAKSTFLANMSHELRTPLNAILGFSEILRRDAAASAEQKENLAIIHKSGEHLLSLINEVLDIAKIEAGHIDVQNISFDVDELIADVTGMLRIRAESKGLKLLVEQNTDFPHHIVGDETKLRQILVNIVSNAIKVTDQGSVTLRLSTYTKPDNGEHLLIEVVDTGCGIALEDQEKLMQPFVQIGPQSKRQGTGLGLAISRQFVQLMGGQLSFTSRPGQGSTFRVEIPLIPARPEDIRKAPHTQREVIRLEAGQPAYRVLVVEDQLENQILLMRLLENVGFEVKLSQNGAEAVEQFEAWKPHFIWMDRRMPVMDGVEATLRIRALPGGDAVKIAALTASTFKEEDAELIAAGFDDIVHKPFRNDQIFYCMERLLKLRFEREKAVPTHDLSLSMTAIAAVPLTLRQELCQALCTLHSDSILNVIAVIGQVDPDLASVLRERIHAFDYEAIRAVLKAVSSGEEEKCR